MNHSLYKTIELFCKTLQPYEVLSSLLDITISQFAIPGTFEDEHKKSVSLLKDKEFINKFVFDLIKEYERGITTEGWCDPWGDIYQELSSNYKRSGLGQYFTPKHLCSLTAELNCSKDTLQNKTISDPACGSGRMLIAAKSLNPNNYFFGEDLDPICCKMTVCNFLFHGCIGEVINHNTLSGPKDLIQGWRIFNAGYPVPVVEKILCPEQSFICSGNTRFIKLNRYESIVEAIEQLITSDQSDTSHNSLPEPEIKNLTGEQLSLF